MKKLLLIAIVLIGLVSCEKVESNKNYSVFIQNKTEYPFKEVHYLLDGVYYIHTNEKFKDGIQLEKRVPKGFILELILIYGDNDVYTDELHPIIGDVEIYIKEVYIPVGGLAIQYNWL